MNLDEFARARQILETENIELELVEDSHRYVGLQTYVDRKKTWKRIPIGHIGRATVSEFLANMRSHAKFIRIMNPKRRWFR